jgi:hypothetical protein
MDRKLKKGEEPNRQSGTRKKRFTHGALGEGQVSLFSQGGMFLKESHKINIEERLDKVQIVK